MPRMNDCIVIVKIPLITDLYLRFLPACSFPPCLLAPVWAE